MTQNSPNSRHPWPCTFSRSSTSSRAFRPAQSAHYLTCPFAQISSVREASAPGDSCWPYQRQRRDLIRHHYAKHYWPSISRVESRCFSLFSFSLVNLKLRFRVFLILFSLLSQLFPSKVRTNKLQLTFNKQMSKAGAFQRTFSKEASTFLLRVSRIDVVFMNVLK